jgi:hypothetical protein
MLQIGLYRPLDGITNHKYKLMHFLTAKYVFCNDKKTLAFNRDKCCHLLLCLQLILFHWSINNNRDKFIAQVTHWIEQRALKNVNNCLNTNIHSYLETSGGQSYNLYLNVVDFFNPSVY